MDVVDLTPRHLSWIAQAARILHETLPQGWPTFESARAEVWESFGPGRLSRVAVDEGGEVLGWIGAIRRYSHAWELHPLAVRPDRQRQGIGSALVRDLEDGELDLDPNEGTHENGGVGIADHHDQQERVGPELAAEVAGLRQQIIDGELEIESQEDAG